MPLRLLYSIAIFVNAALLFWIQPLAAKMILPYVEGVPAVWGTPVCFSFKDSCCWDTYMRILAILHLLRDRSAS